MPLPKIRDGQKLSLMLPADVVERLKFEAVGEGTIPALIVLEALDQFWGGESEAANPTTDLTPKQRRSHMGLLRHLEDLVIKGMITVEEITTAAGVGAEDFHGSWRTAGYVPVACSGLVVRLLASKRLPLHR
jgi:hypothetical protein